MGAAESVDHAGGLAKEVFSSISAEGDVSNSAATSDAIVASLALIRGAHPQLQRTSAPLWAALYTELHGHEQLREADLAG